MLNLIISVLTNRKITTKLSILENNSMIIVPKADILTQLVFIIYRVAYVIFVLLYKRFMFYSIMNKNNISLHFANKFNFHILFNISQTECSTIIFKNFKCLIYLFINYNIV